MEPTLEQASTLLKSKKIKLATKLYRELIQLNPNNALAYQGLATCLYASGRYDDAFDTCQKALELDASLSIPHRIMANIYWNRRKLDSYEQELHNAILKDPDSSDLYMVLGGLLMHKKRTEESISMFQKAVELDPNNWITHHRLSSAYLRLSKRKETFTELRKAYNLKKSFATGFAFISAFMALNWLWLFPLLLAAFFFSLTLPLSISLPFAFIVAGLQLASGISHLSHRDMKNSIISFMLLMIYIFVWLNLKI